MRRNTKSIFRIFQLLILFSEQTSWKQGRRKLFSIGGLEARAEGQRKFLNLESLKCHFLDFGKDLIEL